MTQFSPEAFQPQLVAAATELLNTGNRMAEIFSDWKGNPGSILKTEECAEMDALQAKWISAMAVVNSGGRLPNID